MKKIYIDNFCTLGLGKVEKNAKKNPKKGEKNILLFKTNIKV